MSAPTEATSQRRETKAGEKTARGAVSTLAAAASHRGAPRAEEKMQGAASATTTESPAAGATATITAADEDDSPSQPVVTKANFRADIRDALTPFGLRGKEEIKDFVQEANTLISGMRSVEEKTAVARRVWARLAEEATWQGIRQWRRLAASAGDAESLSTDWDKLRRAILDRLDAENSGASPHDVAMTAYLNLQQRGAPLHEFLMRARSIWRELRQEHSSLTEVQVIAHVKTRLDTQFKPYIAKCTAVTLQAWADQLTRACKEVGLNTGGALSEAAQTSESKTGGERQLFLHMHGERKDRLDREQPNFAGYMNLDQRSRQMCQQDNPSDPAAAFAMLDARGGTCWRCGEAGHWQRDCNRPRPSCEAFARGNCMRGASCPDLHVEREGGWQPARADRGGRMSANRGRGGRMGRGADSAAFPKDRCYAFSQTGPCNYGDSCRFSYGHQGRASTRVTEHKAPTCFDHASSRGCRRGSACKFSHDRDRSQSPRQAAEGQSKQPEEGGGSQGAGAERTSGGRGAGGGSNASR